MSGSSTPRLVTPILVVTVLGLCATLETQASTLAWTLALLGTVLYVQERTALSLLFLGVAVNQSLLGLALWLTDGNVSYLGDASFNRFYVAALLLEMAFWASLAFSLNLQYRRRVPTLNGVDRACHAYPVRGTLGLAVALLSLEIALSSGQYFSGYAEASDTGTVAYEVGALLVALSIALPQRSLSQRPPWPLLMLAVGLVLVIATGSGKRLPLAYVVIAVLMAVQARYDKLLTALAFVAVTGAAYAFGILRDAMTLQSLDGLALAAGLEATNQGGVLHASAVYLRIVDEGLSVFADRAIAMFSNVIGAWLLPLSLLPTQAQVNLHAMQFYPVQGNGGFIGSYAYFFLGWAGPVAGAAGLGWLLSQRGRWVELLGLMLLLCSPRWTLYNVGAAVRLMSMVLLLLVLLEASQIILRKLLGQRSRSDDPRRFQS